MYQEWGREDIISNSMDIEKIIRGKYEQIFSNDIHKFDEMETFLERQKLSKLTQEEIDKLNSSTFIF